MRLLAGVALALVGVALALLVVPLCLDAPLSTRTPLVFLAFYALLTAFSVAMWALHQRAAPPRHAHDE